MTTFPHRKKNQLLCSIQDPSESDVGTIAHFPIRALDYDEKNQMLFTGDEQGYMNKWDVSRLNEKLDELVSK